MKQFMRSICLILAVVFILTVPVSAQAEVETRASSYFVSHETYLTKILEDRFKIWFDVTATGTMQRLGVSKIEVDHSPDGQNWELVATYDKLYYPAMTATNTAFHTSYITYYAATPGYYYRAYVTFYAKNSNGTSELSSYTAVLHM